jgi:PAS domain S-box-containing protein
MTTFTTARHPTRTVLVLPVFITDPTGETQHAGCTAGPLTGEQAATLLGHLPQIIWTAGPEGGLDYLSPRFYTFTGTDPRAGLGWQWMQVIHPDDVMPTLDQWRQCLPTGAPYRAEHRIRRSADGQYVWHLAQAEPVRDAAGRITQWVGASVDIHEQKLREAASRDAEALEARVVERTRDLLFKNTELAKANQTLDSIVHIAGHDLRSPINNLKALLSIHDHTDNEDEKAQLMRYVRESVRRLDGTVGGLLRILETNYSTETLVQHLSFADALEVVLADYGEEARRLGVRLLPDFYDCPRLRYNETYLLSILRNLVSNAIKYRSPKRPLQLEITAGRSGECVVLSVRDNGIGMDGTQVRDKLFKPFSRLSADGDGKGLGLHLVKSMVEKNGGYIRVESTPDVGTTFRVYLKEYE